MITLSICWKAIWVIISIIISMIIGIALFVKWIDDFVKGKKYAVILGIILLILVVAACIIGMYLCLSKIFC